MHFASQRKINMYILFCMKNQGEQFLYASIQFYIHI